MKQFLLVLICLFSVNAMAQTEERVSLLDQLSTDDVIEVTHSFQGCFGSGTETITLSKKDNQLLGLLKGKNGNQENNFSANQLAAFTNFETQLFGMQNKIGFCTNTDTYIVKLNGKVQHTFTDSSCSGWTGFTDLKSQLFSLK